MDGAEVKPISYGDGLVAGVEEDPCLENPPGAAMSTLSRSHRTRPSWAARAGLVALGLDGDARSVGTSKDQVDLVVPMVTVVVGSTRPAEAVICRVTPLMTNVSMSGPVAGRVGAANRWGYAPTRSVAGRSR